MTDEGCDYAFARPGGAALQSAGKLFAGRYLWYNTASKGINQAEWNDLVGHGVQPFFIYEEDGTELLNGYAYGISIAQKAESYRINNGLPVQPIAFCVDFDASPAQQAAINDTLNGAASVLGKDRTWLYAGYWVVKRAFDAGIIGGAFQTYAWSGGNVDARANVLQYLNGQLINGGAVDLCRTIAGLPGHSSAPASGGSGSSAPAGATNITNRPTIDMQRALVARGFNTGGIDGIYGPMTRAAVMAFQSSVGITADGIYGPVTDSHLFGVGLVVDGILGHATITAEQRALGVNADGTEGPITISAEQGRTGAHVDGVRGPDTNRHLQQYLLNKGYSVGPSGVDGNRGPDTIAALQRCLNDGKF